MESKGSEGACGIKIKSGFVQKFTRPNLHKLKTNSNISLYIISFVWAFVRIAPDKPYIVDQHDFRLFIDLGVTPRSVTQVLGS